MGGSHVDDTTDDTTDDGEGELPRVLRLLWGHEEPGRRGPKPSHTIEAIGEAAVSIADAHGLSGVSMSAVATALGLTTMALYRYVDSKSDLTVVMVDAAYGAPPRRRPTGPWRGQLEAWATGNHAALLRHPWIVQVPVTDPPLAPNTLRWMERGLHAFASTPLTEQQKLSSLLLLEVYVRGQVLLSTQLDVGGHLPPLERAEADQRYVRRLLALIDEDAFPSIYAATTSGSLQDEGDFAQEEFGFGLQTVLDGIAARITAAGRSAQAVPSRSAHTGRRDTPRKDGRP
jgi:AcrR family transcriptional regulator